MLVSILFFGVLPLYSALLAVTRLFVFFFSLPLIFLSSLTLALVRRWLQSLSVWEDCEVVALYDLGSLKGWAQFTHLQLVGSFIVCFLFSNSSMSYLELDGIRSASDSYILVGDTNRIQRALVASFALRCVPRHMMVGELHDKSPGDVASWCGALKLRVRRVVNDGEWWMGMLPVRLHSSCLLVVMPGWHIFCIYY